MDMGVWMNDLLFSVLKICKCKHSYNPFAVTPGEGKKKSASEGCMLRLSVKSMGGVEDAVRVKLLEAFSPAILEIINGMGIVLTRCFPVAITDTGLMADSHKHQGHAGVRGAETGETHFTIKMISGKFQGKKRLEMHRMVYDCLDAEMKQQGGIHALALKLSAPSNEAS